MQKIMICDTDVYLISLYFVTFHENKSVCNHASLGFIICSVCYVHISVCVIIRICGVCELVQFELRERQKRTHPDAAQPVSYTHLTLPTILRV